MQSKRSGRGFTLAELLIVVAIIAVLVAVAIPVFTSQLERSRESVDFANVRSMYAIIMAAVNSDDAAASYGGEAIRQPDGSYSAVLMPLKQKIDGWTTGVENMSIGGVPSSEWVGTPEAGGACTLSYSPAERKMTVTWSTSFSHMTLAQLHAVDNDKRVAADQKALKDLGAAILAKNWTVAELKENLAILVEGNSIRIADYYQEKKDWDTSDGFRITSTDNGELEALLRSVGYDPGGVMKTSAAGDYIDTTYENSLFYSDELAANQFKNYKLDENMRSIIIESIKTNSDDTIKSMTIYTKAMGNQANLSPAEKAKFSFTIP